LGQLKDTTARYFDAFNQVNRNNYVFKDLNKKYKKKKEIEK